MSLTLARNCNPRNRSKKIPCAYSGSRLPSRQSTDFAQCQHERTALAALRACNACNGLGRTQVVCKSVRHPRHLPTVPARARA